MLVSVKKNYPAVKREMVDDESFDLLLSEVERKDLEELVTFLEKFDCYTKVIQSSKYPTLSLAVFMREELYMYLSETEPDTRSLTQQMKKTMLAKWDDRLPSLGIHYLAALLDPTLKNLKSLRDFLNSRLQISHVQFILDMLCDLGIKNSDLYNCDNVPGTAIDEPNNTVEQTLTESQKKRLAILKKVSTAGAVRNSSAGDFEERLSEELSRYLLISLTEEEILQFELLRFWADRQKTFPILSNIVRIVHCIPASSSEIERTWSAAGLILSSQRSRMNVKNFKYTLFCSKNYDFVSNKKD